MESRSRTLPTVSLTGSVVGAVELALAVLALVALQWLVATLSLGPMVAQSLHRVFYLVGAGVVAQRTMRRREDFGWRTVGVTVALVAAGLAAVIALDAGQWALALGVAAGLTVGVLLAASGGFEWWTGTHTTLALVIVGLLPVFLALAPAGVVPATDGGPAGAPALDVWLASVPRPPVVAGALLYVLGRTVS